MSKISLSGKVWKNRELIQYSERFVTCFFHFLCIFTDNFNFKTFNSKPCSKGLFHLWIPGSLSCLSKLKVAMGSFIITSSYCQGKTSQDKATACQLENELGYINHCWGICEQNSIVNINVKGWPIHSFSCIPLMFSKYCFKVNPHQR